MEPEQVRLAWQAFMIIFCTGNVVGGSLAGLFILGMLKNSSIIRNRENCDGNDNT